MTANILDDDTTIDTYLRMMGTAAQLEQQADEAKTWAANLLQVWAKLQTENENIRPGELWQPKDPQTRDNPDKRVCIVGYLAHIDTQHSDTPTMKLMIGTCPPDWNANERLMAFATLWPLKSFLAHHERIGA